MRVGFATCPRCEKKNVLVANDNELSSQRDFDYLASYYKKGTKTFCSASETVESQLERSFLYT